MSEEKVNEQKTAVCTWTKNHPHLVVGGLVLIAFLLGVSIGSHLGGGYGKHRYEKGYGKMMDRTDDASQRKDFGNKMQQNQPTQTPPTPPVETTQTPAPVETEASQTQTETATGAQN